jgi:hypothetical protein
MPAQKANQPATQPEAKAPAAFRRMLDQMELEAVQGDEEFTSPMVTGIVSILEAESTEEMWEADELDQTGGRDLVDVEQIIYAYTVKFSNNPTIESVFRDSQNRRMYLLIRSARLETGEEFVWNTSAPLLVGKILWLANREMFPVECVIRGTDLGGGQAVLKLKPIPKRAYSQDPIS